MPGLDGAFLSLQSRNSHLHVAAVLVLDPPEGKRSLFSPSTRYAQIRRVVEQRIHLAPPMRQRALGVPFGLHHPVWADDPEFELDDHLRRTSLPAPGGQAELEDLVADVMSRPLDPDRPLWEMVVVEGLAGGRSALVAKLHHAILDGVSGASLLGAFLDLGPRARPVPFPFEPWDPGPLPGPAALLRHAATSLTRQPEVALGALQRGMDAMVEVAGHNRRLSAEGLTPPPAPFSAPRTSLNGTLSSRRRFATVSLPLDDAKLVRGAFGGDGERRAVGRRLRGAPAAAGPAGARSPSGRWWRSSRSPPDPGGATSAGGTPLGQPGVGHAGLPSHRRRGPDGATGGGRPEHPVAKEQERLTGGRLLADLAEISPPALASRAARWASGLGLFNRLPLCNVVVSGVPGPDFALWCAGSRVTALYPVGPVADGVGLNVTAMSYRGSVHLGCSLPPPRPEVADLAVLLDDALGELVGAALDARGAAG